MNPWGLVPLGLGAMLIWLGLMGDPAHLWGVLTGAATPASAQSTTQCPAGQVWIPSVKQCAPLQAG